MEETRRRLVPVCFGIFEVDLQAGELRRQGHKVKLQEQPFQVLVMLLERSGEVVTREELQRKLWPAETFVDFERGLNRAINKLREALGDDADSPRFIETLPRRGYRFLSDVETAGRNETITAGGRRPVLVPVRPGKVEAGASNPATLDRQILPWAAVGVMAVIAIFSYWKPWRTQIVPDRPFSQLDLDLGPDEYSQPAISTDGSRIVFVSKGALAIRRFDQTKTIRLAGTEGAFLPFFSPNGQWVAFFAAHKLQKIAIDGGAPIALCDAPGPGGGSWGDDGNIVAALNAAQGLSRVPADGGAPQPLTNSKAEPLSGLIHVSPQVLPGGKGVLFAAVNASLQGSLRVLVPKDGKLRTLVEDSTYGRYLASGYVVYYQGETLFAAPIDVDRLELTGPAVPLVYDVSAWEDRADFDLSTSGTLVYRHRSVTNTLPSWLYSSGKIEPVLTKPGNYTSPRLSPDGRRVALSLIEHGRQSLWVYDLTRETWNRLTSEDEPEWLPTWTADGEFIAFRSGNTLAWIRSDGSGKVERLAGVSPNAGPWSFSADGKWLAFWPLQPGSDLWIAPVERTPGALRLGQPQLLLQQAGSKGAPAISPDGRWLAYTSSASGRFEVYVTPFSPRNREPGRKCLVSNAGGYGPVWSHSGRELFYGNSDGRVSVAAYAVKGDSFVAGKPRFWADRQMADSASPSGFDVAPDGKRVLVLIPAEDAKRETILHVMLNVDSELRRRTPARRN